MRAAFTYFETPGELGGDGKEFSLSLDAASNLLTSAHGCKTWGQFASLVRAEWSDFIEEWGDDLPSMLGGTKPRRSTPFSFEKLREFEIAGNFVPDPRQAAFDFLFENVPADLLRNPHLETWLSWGGSHPGGGLDCVVSPKGPDGFRLLTDLLHDAGFTGLTFTQSDFAPVLW